MVLRRNATPVSPALKEYVRLFNAQKFFEAHEVLEPEWLEAKKARGPEGPVQKNFYQGLIQIAAALVHVQRGTLEGAGNLLHSASRYLKNIPPRFARVDHEKLLQETRLCIEKQRPFPRLKIS